MKLQKIWVVIGSEAMNLFYSFQSVQLIWICILRSGSFPPPPSQILWSVYVDAEVCVNGFFVSVALIIYDVGLGSKGI